MAIGAGAQSHRMAFSGVASNAQTLRPRFYPRQPRRGALADPAVLIPEYAFQIVPALEQTFGMARQAKIDHVLPIPRVKLGAFSRRQQIVDTALVRRAISASRAFQRVVRGAPHRTAAIRTTQ